MFYSVLYPPFTARFWRTRFVSVFVRLPRGGLVFTPTFGFLLSLFDLDFPFTSIAIPFLPHDLGFDQVFVIFVCRHGPQGSLKFDLFGFLPLTSPSLPFG